MITSINEFAKQQAKRIQVYHRSNNLDHLTTADFILDFHDDEYSIFGQAIYFASSPNITNQLGKYLAKYSIVLEEPTLDMNKSMTNKQANTLLKKFVDTYKTEINYYNKELSEQSTTYDFSNDYDGVQYGEFFLELQEIMKVLPNKYYKNFIQSMGYKSFKHYCDYGTNFITEKGDYGYCYGIYKKEDVKFVDGPF
jgi:hypothetical protein